MDFFNDGSYRFVTNMINEKIDVLKENGEFNEKYTRMYDLIDEFDLILEDNQKKKFNEIMELIYNTEEYYFALAYSLGVKYGKDLEKL